MKTLLIYYNIKVFLDRIEKSRLDFYSILDDLHYRYTKQNDKDFKPLISH